MVQTPRNSNEAQHSGGRLPHLRDPHGFYDLLIVNLCLIGLIALEFAITQAVFVRLEVLTITAAVLVWDIWATFHILERVDSNWWSRGR
ncbi:hypothetical protein ATJ93_3952 [Halopiger aswanensis]|uniref:Uncharacterized protein n=1 Tax=Halopiger aswanensis TaxID=148449 RepID=A0A419W0X7_9EURY|nr:hypothetical protein ATJ93_3952 [Halopiger aswanensis]